MKKIPLFSGSHHHRVATGIVALVDDEDAARVSEFYWTLVLGYAVAKIQVDGQWKNVPMHRLVMDAKPGSFIDHKDGNKLNCKKENLRWCTKAQNAWNARPKRNSTAGFKGISRQGHKWVVKVEANGKRHYIGSFPNQRAASIAYDLWAIDLHGEFARPNHAVVLHGP